MTHENEIANWKISGDMNEEEEVLQWLITQKTEDRIELITRQMLETMVEETQYLAVYFCKYLQVSSNNNIRFDFDFKVVKLYRKLISFPFVYIV